MATVNYEQTETTITKDLTTQEATHLTETVTKSIRVESEEPYIKVYTRDIHKLYDLAPMHSKFLYEFFSMADWNTHELQISGGKKAELALKYNTTKATIDNVISKLTKKDIIIKKGTGLYILNPYLFGKGTWGSIRTVRSTVDYDTETKKLIIVPEPQDPIAKVEKQWKDIEDIDAEIEDMEARGMLNAS
ncbi:MAG: replication/maintenance protein RepL [Sulfuricurvum sp.]|nr:replication/maintenance protein RepL [Sulfuricurvum sp.]